MDKATAEVFATVGLLLSSMVVVVSAKGDDMLLFVQIMMMIFFFHLPTELRQRDDVEHRDLRKVCTKKLPKPVSNE